MRPLFDVLTCCLLVTIGSCQRIGGGDPGFRGGGRGSQTAGLDLAAPSGPSGDGTTAEGDSFQAAPIEQQRVEQRQQPAAKVAGGSAGQRFRAQVRQRPQFIPAEAPAADTPDVSSDVIRSDSGNSRTRSPVFAGSRGPQFDRAQPSGNADAAELSPAIDVGAAVEPVDVPVRSRRPFQRPSSGGDAAQRRPPQSSSSTPFSRRPAQSSLDPATSVDEQEAPAAARVPEAPRQRPVRPTPPAQQSEDPTAPDGDFVSECPIADGFFADAYECDRYYECRNNQITEHVCKDGLAFNDYSVKFGRCDFTFMVDCTDRPNLQPPQPTPNCPRANGYFEHPDPTKCTEFFFCTDGTANPLTCPGGLIFNPKTGVCAWPEEAKRKGCGVEDLFDFTCPKQSTEITAVQRQQHPRFPDPKDCQFFYLCIDGITPRRNGCPLGQVFNDVTGNCDEPKNVPDCIDWYKDDPRVQTTTTTTTTRRPAGAEGSTSSRLRPNRQRLPSRRRPAEPTVADANSQAQA